MSGPTTNQESRYRVRRNSAAGVGGAPASTIGKRGNRHPVTGVNLSWQPIPAH